MCQSPVVRDLLLFKVTHRDIIILVISLLSAFVAVAVVKSYFMKYRSDKLLLFLCSNVYCIMLCLFSNTYDDYRTIETGA